MIIDELLKWAQDVAFEMGFVVVILRLDTSNEQPRWKTFVVLGCKRGGKYRQYKQDLQTIVSGTRKCDCVFRLRERPLKVDEG